MEKANNSSSGGVGFIGLLQIAFIVLKFIGVIEWSWFWVLSPTWISLALALMAIAVYLAILKFYR